MIYVWENFATLGAGVRSEHTTNVLKNNMYIFGGNTEGTFGTFMTTSVEIVSENTTKPGPSLPKAIYDHCSVELTEDSIILIGGVNADTATGMLAETWIFDGQKYESGPNLKKVRAKFIKAN